jgi:hypothetical protein
LPRFIAIHNTEDETESGFETTNEPSKEMKEQIMMSRLSTVKVGKISNYSDRKSLEQGSMSCIIWPWSKNYKSWWGLTVACAIITVFTECYTVAFSPAGFLPYDDATSIIEYILVSIFIIDIVVSFHLVYYDEHDNLVSDKRQIAVHYLRGQFWLDFAGIFPCYLVALVIAGELGNDNTLASYLSLLRLVKLVRLHRMKQLFDILQYNPHVSLLWLTLIRNLGFALIWSHFSACVFYFIARHFDFNPDETWIGGSMDGLNGFERYVTSLYWSVVTVRTHALR